MKKSPFLALAALLLIGGSLSGCPVYEANNAGCFDDLDCADGSVCDHPTGACIAPDEPVDTGASCRRPRDCDSNETCSRFGTCSAGDCHFSSVGCVRGYVCSSASGRWQCEEAVTGAGGADAGGTHAGGTTSAASDAGAGGTTSAASDAGAGGNATPSAAGAGGNSAAIAGAGG